MFSGKVNCKSKVTGKQLSYNTNMNQAYGEPYMKSNEKGVYIILTDGTKAFARWDEHYYCFDEKGNWRLIARVAATSR